MTIVVVGPGALGTLLAAFLSKSKEKVWLLDKNAERCRAIAQAGISVEGVSGKWQAKVSATNAASQIGVAQLVIICVKSYDTKEAVSACRPLITDETRIVTLQNGIGNCEAISEIVGLDKVIGGVTNLGSTLIGPGRVVHAGKGETVIGKLDGRIPVEMRAIRELFTKVGLEIRLSRDIKGLLWSKLIINCGINALTATTRLRNGALLDYDGTKRILREAVLEAVRVARRKRIKLIYDDPLAKVEAVCEATRENVSSMLQDVLKKKRTEIDFINGVIIRHAKESDIAVPVNTVLFDLVKTLEASYAVTL